MLFYFLISSAQYVEAVRGLSHVKGPLDKTRDLQMALADMGWPWQTWHHVPA